MAKKRKVVNKSLIGLLTVTGMVISVVVVWILVTVVANKDPEIWATKGREYMQQGKYEDAMRMFGRAYDNSKDGDSGRKDVKYLLEYSRAELAAGDVGKSFANLAQAHAIKTEDTEILKEIVDRLWEFRRYFGDRSSKDELEYTEKLLKLDPNNANATALRVIALSANSNENKDYADQARELLAEAKTKFPNNPRVTLAELMVLDREVRKSLVGVTDQQKVKEATDNFRKVIVETGVPVIRAHPEDIYLTRIVVAELASSGKEAEALEILDRAVAANPDSIAAMRERARFFLSLAQSEFAEGDKEAATAAAERAIAAADSVLAKEPGILELVSFRAGAEMIKAGGFSGASKDDFEKTLEIYNSYFEKSLELKGQHIWFSRAAFEHVRLILNAFNVASVYASNTTDEARKLRGREWMKVFVDQAGKRFSQNPIADFMRGRYHIVIGEKATATTDFEKAAKSRVEDRTMFLQIFGMLPSQNLALLYRDLRQPGEALRWTEEATKQYEELAISPPIDLQLNRGELLNELGREREALDFLNAVRSVYKFDPRIDQVRARSLQLLGRADEAEAILAKLGSDNDSIRFSKAEAALANKDYDAAERELRTILAESPSMQAVRMLLSIFNETDRKQDGVDLIASLKPRVTDENARRQLEAWNVLLTEPDPERQRLALEGLVKEEADPFRLAMNLYNLAYMKGDRVEARTHLDAAEKLKPQDRQVLEFQLALALQDQEWDRAERYVNKLRDLNADNAGGATYRGSFALAQGKFEDALKNFYDAEAKLPSLSTLKFKIAQAHVGLGQTERALEVLNDAMKSNPKDVAVRRLLYALLRDQGRSEEAAEHLRVAVEIAPNDPSLKAEREYLEEEDNPADGINRRLAQLKENPDDIDNIRRIAELFIKARDLAIKAGRADKRDEAIARAEEMIQRGLEVAPGNPPMVNFARRYYTENGAVEKAEAAIRNFAEKSENPRARLGAELMLAELYEKVGKYELVDQSFSRARQIVTSSTDPEKQRRMTLMQLSFTELQYNARIGREDRSLEIAAAIKKMVNRDDADEARFYRMSQIQLARSLLAQRKALEAEPILSDYLKLNQTDSDAIMLRAEMWLQRGEIDKSIDDLTKVLVEQPDNLLVRYTRGDLKMRTRQYASAQQDLQRVKSQVIASKDEQLKKEYYLVTLSKLATLFEITEQYVQAESELRAMIDELGKSLEQQNVQQAIADRLLRLLKRTDALSKAERVCAEFMAKYREAPYWPYQLGLLLNEGKKYSAAADRFQQAMALSLDRNLDLYSICFAERLKALIEANRTADAIAVFTNREVADVAPLVTFVASRAYRAAGQNGQADELEKEALTDGLRRSPTDLLAVIREMSRALSTEEFQQSWDAIVPLIDDEVVRARIRNIQAQDLIANSEQERALTRLAAGLSLADKNLPEHVAALVMQAQVMDQLNRVDEAKAAYEAILLQRPDEISTLNNLAFLLATKADQPKTALEYSQQAINLAKGTAPLALVDTHAWILHLNGKNAEAEGRMREGLSVDPFYMPLLDHLAQLLESQGKKAEASKLFLLMRDVANRDGAEEYQKKANEGIQRLQ